MNVYTFWALIGMTILHLLFLIIFITILFSFSKRFWSGEIKYKTEKAMAFGIVALLFPKTLNAVILEPIARICTNLERLFFSLFQNFAILQDQGGDKSESHLINESFVPLANLFKSFAISDLVLLVACTIALYHLFRKIKPRFDAPVQSGSLNKSEKRILIYNLFIALSLVLSIYFVLVVFVSIPYLNELKKPSSFSKILLDSTLKKMSAAVEPLKAYQAPALPDGINLDSLLKSSEQAAAYQSLSAPAKKNINIDLARVNEDYTFIMRARAGLVDKLNKVSKEDFNSRQIYIQRLTSDFETVGSDIAVDKNLLYRDLVATFESSLNLKQLSYKNLYADLAQSDLANQMLIKSQTQRLRERISKEQNDNLSAESGNVYSRVYFSRYFDVPLPDYQQVNNAVIKKSKDGSDWGLLGLMSRFLIVTKSQELTLLIGMIGFGILGASILSFVSTDDFVETFTHEPIIKNFPNVLARGFGAALIIYLAAKGGLAIFSGGANSDPNGYILLLTCFVGAVYSDKVWSKVSVSLLSDAKNNQAEKQPGQGQTKSKSIVAGKENKPKTSSRAKPAGG